MKPETFDRTKCKLLLRISQGFPSQFESSKARIELKKNAEPRVSPSRAGHAISDHLRGASVTSFKTKFGSLDDMADALALLLNSAAGQQAIQRLQPAHRETVSVRLNCLFAIQATVDGIGQVLFNRHDMTRANISQVACVAVLEGRLRGAETYLHVQTFYPLLSPSEIEKLLDAKTS
jgi:hypothetical protein